MCPYFGGRLTFKVTKTTPLGAVIVTQQTQFSIVDMNKKKDEPEITNIKKKLNWIGEIIEKMVELDWDDPHSQTEFTLFISDMYVKAKDD